LMRSSVLLFLCAAVAVIVAGANPFTGFSADELKFKTWAVLVAGSSGWDNYRHQADVCHAYHAIHSLGVPEDHIIVMMTDDIAYHEKNPYPGKIFNDEHCDTDYYEGVPHDYTGELVSAEVFTSIVTGEDMMVGSKKSLKSGPEDNVFIFYDDHGDYDSFIFPDRNLDSDDMQNIIDTMTQRKMYKNLILYDEACLSGSLFYKLNFPDNVYVTTAAPVGTFSFGGCGNKKLGFGTCDAYSHAWITDMEKNHNAGYTFSNQFDVIQEALRESQTSQSCWYGSKKIFDSAIDDFFDPSFALLKNKTAPLKPTQLIPTDDFDLDMAKKAFVENPTDANLANLNRQIAIRKAVDEMGIAIVSAAKPDLPHLATVPCKTCSKKSCECMEGCIDEASSNQCGGKPDVEECCKYECCNEESCFHDPTFALNSDLKRRDTCVKTLSRAFSEACGRGHPYLLTTNLLFIRVCKQQDIDMKSALDEIRAQCSKFDINSF